MLRTDLRRGDTTIQAAETSKTGHAARLHFHDAGQPELPSVFVRPLARETTKPAAEYHHAKLEKHSSWSNLRRNFDFTPVRPRPDPAVNPARLSAGCRTAAALGRDRG